MEEIDVEGATERVNGILHPDVREVAPGKTVVLQRKTRSDKGTTKPKPPVDPDEISMTFTVRQWQDLALYAFEHAPNLARDIQDELISRLQKKLVQLQR